MSTPSPKSERTPPAGRRPDLGIDCYTAAGLLGTIAAAVAFALIAACLRGVPRLSGVAAFWLGLVPLHVVALATALAVIRQHCRKRGAAAGVSVERTRDSGQARGDCVPRPNGTAAREPMCGSCLRMLGLSCDSLSPRVLAAVSAKILLAVYPVTAAITMLTVVAFSRAGYEATDSAVVELIMTGDSVFMWASVLLGAVVVAPFAEEVLFRLVLFEMLRLHGIPRAAAATSLAFALLHRIPEALPGLFVLGMTLQAARRKYRSLWFPIAIHAGFNAVSLLAVVAVKAVRSR